MEGNCPFSKDTDQEMGKKSSTAMHLKEGCYMEYTKNSGTKSQENK